METISELHGIFQKKSVDSLFLEPQKHETIICKALKNIFDVAVRESVRPFGPLDTLITENLDSESIWEEIQTRNRPVIRYIKLQIQKRKAEEERLEKEVAEKDSAIQSDADCAEGSHSDSMGESVSGESGEEDSESDKDSDGDEESDEDDSDRGSDEDGDSLGSEGESEEEDVLVDEDGRTSRRYDAMDDDMEAFLDRADDLEEKYQRKLEALEKKNKGHRGVLELDDYDSDDHLKDETDDMFEVTDAIYASDDDEEEDEDEEEDGITAEDFFGKDVSKFKDKKKSKGKRSVAFAEVPDEEDREGDFDGEDDWDGEDEEDEEAVEASPANKPTSRHAKQEAAMHRQIEELEADLIKPKNWDLAGEVGAATRPENSLLGIVSEVDRSSKPAPIITQQYSATIEELIKRRILEDRWDDMLAPSATAGNVPATGARGGAEGGNDFELSQEKSKEGLGELYANEFLKNTLQYSQSAGQLEEKRSEVRELFDKVCRNLDALSHFYFQPKPVTREAQLTSVATNNVASMSVEDFMPVVESTAAAVAPEQVLGKKHGREVTLLSRDEMTSEDRKALRRAHKASNRKEKNMRKHEEKLVAKMNPGMGNKYEKQKTLDIIRSDKRVTMMGDTGGGKRKNAGNAVGNASEKATSSNMFRQLQDEAKRSIDEKRKKPRV